MTKRLAAGGASQINPETERLISLIYERALAHFGPRHWWPGETREEVIVGAVLTQNTAWRNVERAIENLRGAGALSLRAIVDLPESDLARLIRPAGYFNVKARRLRSVAGWFRQRCAGAARPGRGSSNPTSNPTSNPASNPTSNPTSNPPANSRQVPLPPQKSIACRHRLNPPPCRRFAEAGESIDLSSIIGLEGARLAALRAELLDVPGAGPETADSILLYALDGATFVVDAYTKRIGERHGLFPPGARYEEVKAIFEGALGLDLDLFNDYHAQLVELGKNYCRPRNPRCAKCPLGASECFAAGRQGAFNPMA